MAENVISIGFTNKELEELKVQAKDRGISVQQYIKLKALADSEFFKRFEDLKSRVQSIPSGTIFTVKMVFGTDWLSISKGVRLALGRNFFDQVNSGAISGITTTTKDSANTQQYRKD